MVFKPTFTKVQVTNQDIILLSQVCKRISSGELCPLGLVKPYILCLTCSPTHFIFPSPSFGAFCTTEVYCAKGLNCNCSVHTTTTSINTTKKGESEMKIQVSKKAKGLRCTNTGVLFLTPCTPGQN